MSAVENLILIGFPYAAMLVFLVGIVWRFRRAPFSVSSLSSQFLETKWIAFGSIPFHLGIIILFFGHLIPLVLPGPWRVLMSNRTALLTVEVIGMGAAVLTVLGLVVLFIRRVTHRAVQSTTTVMDLIVLGVLLAQVVIGLGVATLHRWGALWSVGTTTPYLLSLLMLQPDASLVAGMPPLMKLHLAGAWIVLALIPFTRLAHIFSIPLEYLRRPPQKVVWASERRRLAEELMEGREVEGRRLLLRGVVGVGAAGALLSIGVMEKLFSYFRGPEMSVEEEATLLNKRLERLEMTAEQRELQLERMRSAYIYVATLGQLSRDQGFYFIDYEMRPALAFKTAEGLPHLISAKCTHLGCTVAKEVDAEGRILCPCHVSYFDLSSGAPEPGSPAKAPLPALGWVLREPGGEIVISRGPDGSLDGDLDRLSDDQEVWIARRFAEQEA
ncbi:MAG: respiratory nitrate reductase subunit gamma [Thermoanaerobaculia bacterium]|nr:respiratory nitrate reductase subunit gamma [Thermoanaerobaculia bacterium]